MIEGKAFFGEKKELKRKREFCFAFFCYVFNASNNVQNRTVSHFDSTYNLLSISDIKAMKRCFLQVKPERISS